MITTSVHRGATVKTVTFANASEHTDREIERAALHAARETRSSLFGIRVERHADGGATVRLDTD